MSQQLNQETELRRSSRTRNSNRKNYSDYFSDDDMLTEHDDDIEEEEDLEEEEEYEDISDEEYIQEDQEEGGGEASDDSSDNDSGKEEQQSEASVKNINTKFACGLCSNTLSDPYIIPACCHRFCCKCIQESLKAGIGPCPTCRDQNTSLQSLRRDELMGRLLTRYKMLQEKIQKKKIDEGGHEIQKKSSLESTATDETVQGEVDDKNTATSSGTRKRRKREISSNENSSKTSSSDPKSTKESAQAKSSSSKKVSKAPKNKKRKAKRSNDVLTFNERLRCLREFKKKYGHVNVPKNCRELSCHEGLGRWCSTMRQIKAGTYKQFTNPEFKLTKKRMKVLEDMGFRWSSTKTFEEYFQELQAFKERHGHCRVPKEYKENKALGSWCARLRLMKSGIHPNTGSSQLTPERVKRLEDLGFRCANVYRSFDENFNALQTFKRKKGHCNVTACNNTEDPPLANWVSMIRSMKAGRMIPFARPNTKLTEARIAKLDALGFEWTRGPSYHDRLHKFTFDDYVRDLKAYKAKHGDCYVPDLYKDNRKLGRWVSKIRAIRAGTKQSVNRPYLNLNEERITELDSIGFKWRGCKTFDEYMVDLRQFKAKHGHCNVPYRYPENKSLGSWVGRTRRKKLGKEVDNGSPENKLTKERIAQLDKMGFIWRLRDRS